MTFRKLGRKPCVKWRGKVTRDRPAWLEKPGPPYWRPSRIGKPNGATVQSVWNGGRFPG